MVYSKIYKSSRFIKKYILLLCRYRIFSSCVYNLIKKNMARPIESQLYRELVDSRFIFIERGIIEINEIYNAVKRQYPDLCDDEFTCVHHQNVGIGQSEWKHTVRTALLRCRRIYDNVEFSGRRGYWIFT